MGVVQFQDFFFKFKKKEIPQTLTNYIYKETLDILSTNQAEIKKCKKKPSKPQSFEERSIGSKTIL